MILTGGIFPSGHAKKIVFGFFCSIADNIAFTFLCNYMTDITFS